jgi:hypothetical protein
MNEKSLYAVIVFFEDGTRPKKWNYVGKLNGFALFLEKNHPTWAYMNVYLRHEGRFIKQLKKGCFIPGFL